MSLAVRGLGKSYGVLRALDAVTFTAEAGEILAICGENGAGKSTLMSILAGSSGGYDGEVDIDGKTVILTRPADAELHGISMLPQELIFYPELSIAENLLLGTLPTRAGFVSRRTLLRRARSLCETVGLEVDVNLPMRTLAVSDRQLVCIARALSTDPRVLILDEPTAVLPRDAADNLFAVLRNLAAAGTTVLYVSHHLSEVSRLADRVAVLRNGSMCLPPTADLTVEAIVEAMSGGVPEPSRQVALRELDEAVLQIEIETIRRGRQVAVQHFDLTVHRREIVGVAGLAGSGRDDLVELLGGGRRHSFEGSILVAGRPIARAPHLARRQGVQFVPAERRSEGLMMLDSVVNNLFLGKEGSTGIAGFRRRAAERREGAELVRRFGVHPPELERRVGQLSGGNQQKVLLARAIGRRDSCLVLAEPTRGVDVTARAAIHSLLFTAAENGAALLVSSSDTDELLSICNRIVVFHDGRLIADRPTDDLDIPTLLRLVTAGAGTGDPAIAHPTRDGNGRPKE